MPNVQRLVYDSRSGCNRAPELSMHTSGHKMPPPLNRAHSCIQTQHGERVKVGSSKGERGNSRRVQVSIWHLTTGWSKHSQLPPPHWVLGDRPSVDSTLLLLTIGFQEPTTVLTAVCTGVEAWIIVNAVAKMLVTRLRMTARLFGAESNDRPWGNYRQSASFAQQMACWPGWPVCVGVTVAVAWYHPTYGHYDCKVDESCDRYCMTDEITNRISVSVISRVTS